MDPEPLTYAGRGRRRGRRPRGGADAGRGGGDPRAEGARRHRRVRRAVAAGRGGRPGRRRDPVLAAASDGVGTKLLVAQALDRHDTVGIDLVAMVVDDVVVTGAEPLFVLDYLAVGRVDPERGRHRRRGGRGLPAGPLRPARRGDGRAPRRDGAGRLRPGRVRPRHGGARPAARPRPGRRRRRAPRPRRLGLTPTATAWPAGSWPGPGSATTTTSRARRPGRGGAAHPDPDLRPHLVDLLAAGVEVHALCHVTGGGLPGNLPRCLPPA